MERFEHALAVVLDREGGFVNDAADPGGATKWGISLRWLQRLGDSDGDGWLDGDLDRDGDVDATDIKGMTEAEAAELYRYQWWDRYGYDRIESLWLATKAFELAVNMGPGRSHQLLQRALQAVFEPVRVDGGLGPLTVGAVNRSPWAPLLAAFASEAAGFYRELVIRKPVRAKWINGWTRRAYAFPTVSGLPPGPWQGDGWERASDTALALSAAG